MLPHMLLIISIRQLMDLLQNVFIFLVFIFLADFGCHLLYYFEPQHLTNFYCQLICPEILYNINAKLKFISTFYVYLPGESRERIHSSSLLHRGWFWTYLVILLLCPQIFSSVNWEQLSCLPLGGFCED